MKEKINVIQKFSHCHTYTFHIHSDKYFVNREEWDSEGQNGPRETKSEGDEGRRS